MSGHPPSLLTLTKRALGGEAKLPHGASLVVAVSGGPDSMALLHVLARLAPAFGLGLHAHGVDHGLRAEAARELDGAEALADKLAVPFARTRVKIVAGGNVQARARAARYAALSAAATSVGAAAIATAHHADDRAETVLLRLLRGAGPRGLAVLPARGALEDGTALVRPLLRARRSAVLAHLARHEIDAASDPSNVDPKYARARVRRELMPLLVALSPGIVNHLTSLADQLADEAPRSMLAVPRATQNALAELMRTQDRAARVWLPGGLVAMVGDGRAGAIARKRENASKGRA